MPNVSFCEDERGVYYNPYVEPPHDYSQDYFTMVITTGGGNVTWTGSSNTNKLSYSTDNGANWSTANSSITLPVSEGDNVLWKGDTNPIEWQGIGKFGGDDNVRYSVEGNTMSLLFGDNFKGQTSLEGKNYALSHLFESNKNIISAKNLSLSATTLTEQCYCEMFEDCTSLTTAPSVLPATTLIKQCYGSMFDGCTSLVTAPELPATTLANGCYYQMFEDCTSLTTAPELPATTLVDSCYQEMFRGCTSLTTTPELPATTLAERCYSSMFNGCTSLTTAPELPATTLANGCYSYMFGGCTNLNSIICLATNIPGNNCTNFWVNNVASSGTFTKASSMTSWSTGTSGIPSGWTVVDA